MIKQLFSNFGFASTMALLMLFSSYPYVFHIIFDLPDDRFMGVLFFCIMFLSVILMRRKKYTMPLCMYVLMAIQSIVWLLYSLMFDDKSYIVRIFFILLTGLTLCLLTKKGQLFQFVKLYNYSLAIQSFLGMIAFPLVLVGMLHPIFVYYYNENRYLYCYGLTCSNAVLGDIMRVGVFFDEPGALAFWGVFAMLFNKLTIDNKKLEILFVISLLFTFSAAFFVILPTYLVLFYYNKIKSFFIICLIMVPIVYIGLDSLSGNEDFAHITTERFSGGEIRSTRYMQAEFTKKIFIESPIIGFGAENLEQYTASTDNPYEILAKDGIVGFFFTYLPLFFVAVKYRSNKNVLFGTVILFMDYMQRPFHINEMHFLIMYLYCLLIIYRNSNIVKYENRCINDLS